MLVKNLPVWTVAIGLVILLSSPMAWGDSKSSPDDQANLSKLDRDLEKYWASRREAPVVKNRLFSKHGRLEVGLLGGLIATDPIRDYWVPGIKLTYFQWEHLGIGLTYLMPISTDAQLERWLQQRLPGQERHGGDVLQHMAHVDLHYAPFYGKLNMLGRKLMHFDIIFNLGAGWMGSEYAPTGERNTDVWENHNTILLNAALGFRMFFTDWMAMRLEVSQYLFPRNSNFDERDSISHRWEVPTLFSLGLVTLLPTTK